eukprot:2167625-Prymnesium_polylepis.1
MPPVDDRDHLDERLAVRALARARLRHVRRELLLPLLEGRVGDPDRAQVAAQLRDLHAWVGTCQHTLRHGLGDAPARPRRGVHALGARALARDAPGLVGGAGRATHLAHCEPRVVEQRLDRVVERRRLPLLRHALEDFGPPAEGGLVERLNACLLYTSPSPRDAHES